MARIGGKLMGVVWAAFLGLALVPACGAGPPREPSGPELTQRLGCLACHAIRGSGGGGTAPLDGIGSRLSAPELEVSLTRPRRRLPKAKMPSYAYVRPAELEALVFYLESLK